MENIRELAREEINKCKDKCYDTNGRNASNECEGDYGTWKDWENVLVRFAKEIQKRVK